MSKKIKIALTVIILLSFTWIFWQKHQPVYERSRPALGTVVRIKVFGWGGEAAVAEAFGELDRLTALFNRFSPTSEVARLNRLAGFGPRTIAPEMLEVLRLAEKCRLWSGGAFDVLLGSGHLQLFSDGRASLSLGASLDLGGIAKGYALEKARSILLKRGIKNAIIDSRSSVAVIGGPWKIGVIDPLTGQVIGAIKLLDGEALGTSAQSERPGHIIDPIRRRPAAEHQSVTVITRDAAWADACSTALFVSSEEAGRRLADEAGLKLLIIRKNGEIYDNFGFKLR